MEENELEMDLFYVTNDLLVVLDSSGSISSPECIIAKDFSPGLALAYRDNEDSRVGFTIFSNQVQTVVHPVNTLTPSESATAVQAAIHLQSGTATDLAIENGASLLASIDRGVIKNLVVVTDGMSNNRASTIAGANAAIARGIKTYAVGIGHYEGAELVAIAGGDRSRVFTVPGFNQFLALLRPVSLKMCGP
ncbi:uncharacterized protein LOC110850345 [Folsomia candida]|uniref:uncharacterized protein LOC110850345 n=1 Tax=Folsomia candida TaxID=158441 RepID=UPI0016053B5F|nr:uncharacterized protein LOC110850345 [Folsomia candida]